MFQTRSQHLTQKQIRQNAHFSQINVKSDEPEKNQSKRKPPHLSLCVERSFSRECKMSMPQGQSSRSMPQEGACHCAKMPLSKHALWLPSDQTVLPGTLGFAWTMGNILKQRGSHSGSSTQSNDKRTKNTPKACENTEQNTSELGPWDPRTKPSVRGSGC